MPLGSWLVDKTPPGPRKAILLPAGMVQCAAFGSLALATSVEHFYASMALQGFCSGFIQPAISSFTAEVTEQRMRGQAMSLQARSGRFYVLAGPIALGALADATSYNTTIMFTSFLLLLGNSAFLLRSKS